MKQHHTNSPERARSWQRILRAGGLALATVAATGTAATILGCERAGDPDQRVPVSSSALFAGIPQDGAALGDPAAPVTLTEFSDLRCSHCRDFTLQVLPVLVDRYVRPGRVRIVFRNLPILGERSERAARLAVAAGMQDRMWPFVHQYFAEQLRDSAAASDPDGFLRRVAAEVPDLDEERALVDRDAPAVQTELAESRRLADTIGVKGVPAFTIGRTGEPARELTFQRAGDPASFIGAIDELLASPPEVK